MIKRILMAALAALMLSGVAHAFPRGFYSALVQFDESGRRVESVRFDVRIELYAGGGPWTKVLVPARSCGLALGKVLPPGAQVITR